MHLFFQHIGELRFNRQQDAYFVDCLMGLDLPLALTDIFLRRVTDLELPATIRSDVHNSWCDHSKSSPCLALPCRAMPCRAMPRLAPPSPATPCRAPPCPAAPRLAQPCHASPCRALPCPARPCHAAPRPATPSPAMPSQATPCHARPRRAAPWLKTCRYPPPPHRPQLPVQPPPAQP